MYQRNEYDWCVMNNIIDDKQCTILWHIDDLKTLHFYHAVISSVLVDIDAGYGKISKMTIDGLQPKTSPFSTRHLI